MKQEATYTLTFNTPLPLNNYYKDALGGVDGVSQGGVFIPRLSIVICLFNPKLESPPQIKVIQLPNLRNAGH